VKVLVFSPPLGSAGGIQRYTVTLVRALKELCGEASVRVVSMRTTERRGKPRYSKALKLRFGFEALGEVARWRPDLIICTHLALGPVGWLAAAVGVRRCWIVVHGIEAWGWLPYGKRAALRRAGRVLVTSAFNREQVVKRQGIGRDRVSSLPCALDETLLRVESSTGPTAAATRNRLQRYFADDRRVLLTVARMAASERYKGHDVVLDALPAVVARIPNLTYAVVGDGDDRARLETLAADLGLGGHVVFTGEVNDSELAALYRRSEIFVLPARTAIEDRSPKGEGFGIVFLEAMAFGKPVIGPNCGAPAELIRQGENGLLVDPEDPTSVTEALLKLLTNPGESSKMGKAGSDWVKIHYSYGSFRERLREELLSAVDS
jgi:phosphatidyl-myo-inositol dimannoside synthase